MAILGRNVEYRIFMKLYIAVLFLNIYRDLDYSRRHGKFENCYVSSSTSLCDIWSLTVRNPMYCKVDLELKHDLKWNLLVCIRSNEKAEHEVDPIACLDKQQ